MNDVQNYTWTCFYPAQFTINLLNNISRGHDHRFIQPATTVDSYKHLFLPSTIRM